MSAACVCMSERHWRCGVHGTITPALRAAARYAHEHGDERRAAQEAAAALVHVCCGEQKADGHHPLCRSYVPAEQAEVHPEQGTLV